MDQYSQRTPRKRGRGRDRGFSRNPQGQPSSDHHPGFKFYDKPEGQQRKRTREAVGDFNKEKYLEMPLEEKRQVYACRKRYQTLETIPSWKDSYQRIKAERKLAPCTTKFSVDDKLSSRVAIWVGDITFLEVDAIVNAANNSLLGGGGVDGAIHRAAGSSLKAECATLHGCQTADAKITGGYKLPAKYVIHTVGPRGEKPFELEKTYMSCLDLVKEHNLKSVAFPCISTGLYGYPNEPACKVVLKTIRNWLEKDDNADRVELIIFCLFVRNDIELYEQHMRKFFPCSPEKGASQVEEKKTDEKTCEELKKKDEKTEEKNEKEKEKVENTEERTCEKQKERDEKTEEKNEMEEEKVEKTHEKQKEKDDKTEEKNEEEEKVEKTEEKTCEKQKERDDKTEEKNEKEEEKVEKTCEKQKEKDDKTEEKNEKEEEVDILDKSLE